MTGVRFHFTVIDDELQAVSAGVFDVPEPYAGAIPDRSVLEMVEETFGHVENFHVHFWERLEGIKQMNVQLTHITGISFDARNSCRPN